MQIPLKVFKIQKLFKYDKLIFALSLEIAITISDLKIIDWTFPAMFHVVEFSEYKFEEKCSELAVSMYQLEYISINE